MTPAGPLVVAGRFEAGQPGFGIASTAGVAVVSVPAETDLSSSDLFREALAAASGTGQTVIVDFTGNEYCDSSAISVLVAAARQARAQGGEVLLVVDHPAVRRIFKVTGVNQLFRIFDTVDSAIAAPAARQDA